MRSWVIVLAACGAHGPPPLPVAPVAMVAEARADQLVAQGDITYVLGADVTILRGDLVTTRVPVDCGAPCPAQVWTSAAAVPALDGDGRWIVATRFDGTLWRIRLDGELEPIAARFGLAREKIVAVGGAGATIAVLLEHALLVTRDRVHVTRYALDQPARALAVAEGRVALAGPHGLDVWDLAGERRRRYELAAARPAFLAPDTAGARLVAVTAQGAYLERAGELEPIELARIAAVAVAGARLWVEAGKRLYIATDATPLDTTAASAGGEPLFGAPNGDVWVGAHGLRRYAVGAAGDAAWRREIQPIFAKVCAHCHLPGGDAGVDLSTAAAWTDERAALVERVVRDQTMPPAGTDLSASDRATLAHYLGAP